jgi:hypothetical protein
MRVPGPYRRKRRGVTLAECGVVYALALLLLAGLIIVGLGVYRYQQVARLANYGARWASVHGPSWQQATSSAAPTSTSVFNVISPLAVGLDTSNLSCTLSTSSNVVSVTVSYDWIPEGYWSHITLSNTAVMPITY